MRKKYTIVKFSIIYVLIFSVVIIAAMSASRVATTISTQITTTPITVIIDAGHGGEDGGGLSYSGVKESSINLSIALKLNDIFRLIGINTVMIRTTDTSIHTKGNTISQRKISDLKERVRIVNTIKPAILISIHQNYFADDRYSGAQVFYAKTENSFNLAEVLQGQLREKLDESNNRCIKEADGIYLMENVTCPAVLIECGFLSNRSEEALLLSDDYQKRISSTIACTCSRFTTTLDC